MAKLRKPSIFRWQRKTSNQRYLFDPPHIFLIPRPLKRLINGLILKLTKPTIRSIFHRSTQRNKDYDYIRGDRVCYNLYRHNFYQILFFSIDPYSIENGHPAPMSPRKFRVPDEISLCSSSIPGNMYGTCAVKKIPHGTWFGPFEGKLVRTTDQIGGSNTEFMWEVSGFSGFSINQCLTHTHTNTHKHSRM